MSRALAVFAAGWLLVAALLVGACGGSKPDPEADRPGESDVRAPAGMRPLQKLARPEGRLRLLARPGVVQAGGQGSHANWVSGFEKRTGCRVSVTTAPDSRAIADRLATGRFDGVALTGDVTVPLITSGRLAPVNPKLIGAYRDVFEDLREEAAAVSGGRLFAVPVARTVNEIVYRRDRLPGTLRSSGALFDDAQAASYADRLMMPADPMIIADAAIYAQSEDDELQIDNPFELDRRQFDAALAVLREQRPYVGAYWSQPDQFEDALRDGRATVGFGPNGVAARLRAETPPVKVGAVAPSEGATGYIDSWAIDARAANPNCMYRWIQHVLAPRVNAQIAEHAGAAPANRRVCELSDAQRDRCDALKADDAGYWDDVALWRTPTAACGDGRGRVCRTYERWARAWDPLSRR